MYEFPHFQNVSVKSRFVLVPTFLECICKIWICMSSHIFRMYL
ncbi:hypothetical protein LEP1GSC024_0186 [Leptospira noguchii str. 2001034031]|uniref:Uncharacterized protein n=1 Tax=Leptospira noguchii str. 2001034031 TaxID=1193053 RepID=M6Y8D2_9LEPT|nr:hypothetical protein LEP1GSC024_0186 [Leptospira noguchii str. 2001034031]